MIKFDERTRDFIVEHRVAHLATASPDARPLVVPICYAFDGRTLYTPLDEKPKSADVRSLKRVRNIAANPWVSVVIDDYSEGWHELAYVLLAGRGEILEPGAGTEHSRAVSLLRDKYIQYRSMAIESRPIIKIDPTWVKSWSG